MPSLSWSGEDAVGLVRSLVAWHLWCDGRELRAEQRQIHNNLNSWALANAVGYPMPGRELDTAHWLLAFGEAAGAKQLRAILVEQGLERDLLYAALLTLVGRR